LLNASSSCPFQIQRPGINRKKAHKILEGVKIGKTFTKWGNLNENLLNGVISVKN
jgi:hypothetical protein